MAAQKPMPDILEYPENEIGVLLVTTDNNIIGRADDSRLNSLPWYKRIWAKINRRYRNKYIDVKPFKCSKTQK